MSRNIEIISSTSFRFDCDQTEAIKIQSQSNKIHTEQYISIGIRPVRAPRLFVENPSAQPRPNRPSGRWRLDRKVLCLPANKTRGDIFERAETRPVPLATAALRAAVRT